MDKIGAIGAERLSWDLSNGIITYIVYLVHLAKYERKFSPIYFYEILFFAVRTGAGLYEDVAFSVPCRAVFHSLVLCRL